MIRSTDSGRRTIDRPLLPARLAVRAAGSVHFEAAAPISVMALFALELVKALERAVAVVVRLTNDHLPQGVAESNTSGPLPSPLTPYRVHAAPGALQLV